ncbi:PDZ domain-containing protein 11 isoform X2 [Neopelma chrysocephalum]|uniref:PDZ domain-containing protein 11 isoform X2 n=1 Tax=Neopelma chrysocephalum TaxID=114329 RepID=UPI000FCD3311|nr:PDZ domain-containing protein 11 isoform X2 [Neopelma chrysocephalum]
MEPRAPYDDFPVVFLPPYESPPAWVPPHERVFHPDYNNELTRFLPRTIALQKPPGAQLGFNIRGGKASQLGIFISKVCPSLSIPPWIQLRLGFPTLSPSCGTAGSLPSPGNCQG